jgi:hypothetical protein
VAALAVALHARIIVSAKSLCTGVPKSAQPSNGFAAPIRDVTVSHFLPANWNTNDVNVVLLRYRHADPKSGLPSMILTVQRDATASPSPPLQVLGHVLEHVYLDGLCLAPRTVEYDFYPDRIGQWRYALYRLYHALGSYHQYYRTFKSSDDDDDSVGGPTSHVGA